MAFFGCRKQGSPGNFIDDRLVVLAEVTAGDSIEIPVGKTIRAGSGALIGFQKVNDATVILTETNRPSWMLQPNWSAQYSANPTTVFTSRRRFQADSTYTLEVRHPALGTATASTHIPLAPRVLSIDTATEMHEGKPVLAATVNWQDAGSGDHYYVVEALKELLRINTFFYYQGMRYSFDTQEGKILYERVKSTPAVQLLRDTVSLNKFLRLYLYTRDGAAANGRIDDLSNPFRRIFFAPDVAGIRAHSTRVYIDSQFFVSADGKQKGRVLLQLKSASRELYDYLFSYEQYKTEFGTLTTTQLSSPAGNISNGVGIFGGSAKRQQVFYFEKL